VPRCTIHDDAYDTNFICGRCRKDPANADWVKSVDGEADQAEADFVVEQWSPDETDGKIARALLIGRTSLRGAAVEAGCSLTRVQTFVRRVMTPQPEAAYRVARDRLPVRTDQSTCHHMWQARSELGRGVYACRLCNVPGRRSVGTGHITPRVRHEGHRQPEQTVEFKALGEPPDNEDVGARARLHRMHSNRHDDLFNAFDDFEPPTE
jgi:hypothetical protein